MPDRFTEEEARRIFARAAERQHADASAPTGLSMRELQEIGQAAGLDPAHVAVAEVRAGEPLAAPATMWGLDLAPRASRVIPGTASEDQWAQIVARLRRTFTTKGMATEVGRTREWAGTNGQGGLSNLHLLAEPAEGGTRITLETSRLQEAKQLWAFPIVAAVMVLLFTILAATSGKLSDPVLWGFVSFLVLLALAGTGGGRLAFGRGAEQRSRQFDALLDQFELIVRDGSEDVASESDLMDTGAPALLDLDAQPEVADARRGRASRHRTRS